tara:strand:- start:12672 stop:13472 length:801 start_codon:yes stop_codon:yes gene_type:complete
MKSKLEKKISLITGGASGIGLAFAQQLVSENYTVCIVGRNQKKLNEAKQSILDLGGQCVTYRGDVSKWDDLTQIADDFKQKFSSLDLLVVNAGVIYANTVADMPIENIESIFQTNLIGAVKTTKLFSPLMPNKSQILFMASGFGIIGAAGYASYCASKAGMMVFAESLKRELLHKKIKVQVACPADTDTPQYQLEKINKPSWLRVNKQVNIKSAAKVVSIIRKKQRTNRFFIFTSMDVFIAHFLSKISPRNFRDMTLNILLPRPRA